KIALINGPGDFAISKKALKGYQQALKKHGLDFQEEMVIYGDYSESAGYELMKELLENFTPPTAILAGDDMIATGVMKAVREKKLRVPEDISITGCNNMPIASYLTPSLTTIKVPFYEIGRLGAETLIKILSGTELEKTSIVLEPDNLIIRNSTGVKL
ncbi:MAG: substrate-binding domain-containing protein, partial [Candidatus Omnitrophica bacterium]|nr:substrate-binding domain-containing protein [Candidatus Omnitrophota bacterium]